ncbi:MAG TPA: Fe-S cluster assembly protein SufD [Gammaproteobacteria bacterium]|nr:Fe-S cluster assembly protein SufD [Gammaproteobacteria bacterium]
MNTASEALRPYAESFKAFESTRTSNAAWLSDLRRDAFAHFTSRGFPGERDEDWKYTSTRPLEKRAFSPETATGASVSARVIAPIIPHEMPVHMLVFVNGRHIPALGTVPSVIHGLHISSLSQALSQSTDELQPYLIPESIWADDAFTALNTAFLQDGVVIEIDTKTELDRPLQLLFVSTQQTPSTACHPRILIKLGVDSQATLIETYYGLEGAANFTNSFTQIALAEGAQLEHLRLQCESREDFHVSRVHIDQQRDSSYLSHTLNLGGLWVRTDLHARLAGPKAEATFNGLYAIKGRQHVDNHTRIDHLAPDTRSDELYRGIISGHGRAVFNGKVVVAKHAVKTDATQTNNNLLLSRTAEIDTKPELEIYADDVKCSHGATIGQLDEQALFYLRSRGIDLETARGLLIEAFTLKLLERIPTQELRAFVGRQIKTVLPGQSAVMEWT